MAKNLVDGDNIVVETSGNDINLDLSTNFKNALEAKTTYSTTETVIGTWLGKTLYRKCYYISALANTGTVTIPLNINNLEDVYNIYGIASNDTTFFTLPSYRGQNSNTGIQIYADKTYGINITSENDRTNYHANIVLEYTKTTD